MTSQIELKTFDDLLLCNVSANQDTAIQICQCDLDANVIKATDVLSLWLRRLLREYIKDKRNDSTVCLILFKHMCEWFHNLKTNATLDEESDIRDFSKLIADAVDFASWAKEEEAFSSESLVHIMAYFLFAIVQYSLELQRTHATGFDEIALIAIDLHLVVLSLLSEVTSRSFKFHNRIMSLINQLNDISQCLTMKSPQMTNALISTSKTMTYICVHYGSSENITEAMPEWFKKTVIHLIESVLNQLKSIYNQNTMTMPLKRIKEFSKITRAYLMMLCEIFSVKLQNIEDTVFKLLLKLFMEAQPKVTKSLNGDITQLLAKYVRPYIMQILELNCYITDFQKKFIGCLKKSNDSKVDYGEFCLDYITAVIIDDSVISFETCQILQTIFEYLLKTPHQMISSQFYDRLIKTTSTLLHVAQSVELCNYFCNMVTSDEVHKSHASTEVLLLLFRLEEVNQSWNYKTIQFTNQWLELNNACAIFSLNSYQWHVERIVRYFQRILDTTPPIFSISTYRHIRCLPLSKIYIISLIEKLIQLPSTTGNVYEMVAIMELLHLNCWKTDTELEWVMKLLSKVNTIMKAKEIPTLEDAYFKLCLQSNRKSQMYILKNFQMPLNLNSWQLHKFLYYFGEKRMAFNSSASKLLVALQTVSNSSHYEVQLYEKLSYNRNPHCCPQHKGNLKRKRSDSLKTILNEMYNHSLHLLHKQNKPLDANDVAQVTTIIGNLKRVLPG